MVRSFAQHGWSSVAQENRWGSNFDNYLLSLSGAFSFRPAFWRIPQVAAQRKPIARRWWGGKRGRFHDLFVTSHRSAQVTSTSCCWEILALQRVRCTKSHWGLTVDVSWCNLWYSHLWIIDWSCLVYIYIIYLYQAVALCQVVPQYALSLSSSFGQFLKFTHQVAPISVCASCWS